MEWLEEWTNPQSSGPRCKFCHWVKCSLREKSTFSDTSTGFPTKSLLENEHRNSILMTSHYPDLGSASGWLKICFNESEALPCACFSDIVLGRKMLAVFSGYR